MAIIGHQIMRVLILVLMMLTLGVDLADADEKHTPEPAHTAAPEETVVVTQGIVRDATRIQAALR